jgi:hypothetical protein
MTHGHKKKSSKGTENTLKKIIAENHPKLGKEIATQV